MNIQFVRTTFLWILFSLAALAMGVCAAASSPDASTIETPFLRFVIQATNGNCEIFDKAAQVTWRADSDETGFGWVTLKSEKPCRLAACQLQSTGNEITATFHPSNARPSAKVLVRVRALSDDKTLEVSYERDPGIEVESISLLDRLFTTTDAGKGYAVVPAREGLLVPASSGLDFTHRFDTSAYEGSHMQMMGVVEKGAAALLTWDDPYVAADLKSSVNKNLTPSKRQQLTSSLVLRKSANSFQIHLHGKGDYVGIGKAYREIAREKGFLVTWDQKLKGHPERVKLLGAANIKLWSALDRRMNEESTKEEAVHLNWTFDEAAQVAEHLKRDLKLEKVLFTVGGWIHRGYDNQHPDILPTAPECGGDAAFSDCARRVLSLGYLFCLHDNYQDIYRDSPSWNERFIMKTPDGTLARGGHWAGGLAFLTCSQMALELAKRPQNLPAVKKLSNANSYFIDTTYAAGLQECSDQAHPLTRGDDMKWKQALSDYARDIFGVFGSECGREWAIPHSDFFEGLTGVSGNAYHDAKLPEALGATVVPLFELVYHDCIALYGKYGYDPSHAAKYVLHHIILGRPLNYHSMPGHLYWHQPDSGGKDENGSPSAWAQGDPGLFIRADNGWAAGLHRTDRFIKSTYEVLSPLNELTAQMQMSQHEFLTADRTVQRSVFTDGANEVRSIANCSQTNFVCASKSGNQVTLPPFGFMIESATFVVFHALNWGERRYDSPVLFTIRSLDNQPLSVSHQVRVFHAFGDEHIHLGRSTKQVKREEILDPNGN
jgi:hypothetical protein